MAFVCKTPKRATFNRQSLFVSPLLVSYVKHLAFASLAHLLLIIITEPSRAVSAIQTSAGVFSLFKIASDNKMILDNNASGLQLFTLLQTSTDSEPTFVCARQPTSVSLSRVESVLPVIGAHCIEQLQISGWNTDKAHNNKGYGQNCSSNNRQRVVGACWKLFICCRVTRAPYSNYALINLLCEHLLFSLSLSRSFVRSFVRFFFFPSFLLFFSSFP